MSQARTSATQDVAIKEGTIRFAHDGATYATYYKAFGDLSDRTRTPLIALHGGPGVVHNYLLPLADLARAHSVPVILYDQIGNGRSSHVPDKPAEFWTIDLFIAELENLLRELGVQDAFDVFGHSWGGVLGAEFAVRKQPKGLKHLVITNSLASFELWVQSVGRLLQAFPQSVQEGIFGGLSDPKKHREALRELHAVYGCLVRPIPEEVNYSMDQAILGDATVASKPILVGWSIIDRLHLVHVPTFVINGRKDISQDFVVAPFFKHIPKVKWVTLENSSHMPFWEERERFVQLVADFLAL